MHNEYACNYSQYIRSSLKESIIIIIPIIKSRDVPTSTNVRLGQIKSSKRKTMSREGRQISIYLQLHFFVSIYFETTTLH